MNWLCRVTLICQIQRGSVRSSVILQNNLIHTRVLFGNLTERTRTSDSVVKKKKHKQTTTTQNKEYDLYSSEKASFSLLLWVLQKTHIWRNSKKAERQTQKQKQKKSILRQNGKTRRGRWPMMTTDNWSQLLVFSRLGCRHSLLCLHRSRAENGTHLTSCLYMLDYQEGCHVIGLSATRTDVQTRHSGMGMSYEIQNGKEG